MSRDFWEIPGPSWGNPFHRFSMQTCACYTPCVGKSLTPELPLTPLGVPTKPLHHMVSIPLSLYITRSPYLWASTSHGLHTSESLHHTVSIPLSLYITRSPYLWVSTPCGHHTSESLHHVVTIPLSLNIQTTKSWIHLVRDQVSPGSLCKLDSYPAAPTGWLLPA